MYYQKKRIYLANIPDGCAAIQKDLKKMDKWASRNLMKLDTEKCQVLPLWKNKFRYQDRLGELPGTSSAEKGHGEQQVEHCSKESRWHSGPSVSWCLVLCPQRGLCTSFC